MKQTKAKPSRFQYPENVFLIFALSFGLIFVFATGPFQAPDEFTHYFRSYRLSQGSFFTGENLANLAPTAPLDFEDHRYAKLPEKSILMGFPVPKSMEEPVILGIKLKKDLSSKVSLQELKGLLERSPEENTLSFYSADPFVPLPYLPQAFGVGIGRVLGLSPLAWLYLGRVFNLVIWAGMIWGAIRLTPIMKSTFSVLALLPMSLFLASSLSYDAFTNGISFLWIALVLRLCFGKPGPLSRRDWAVIAIVSLAVSISKYVYGPLLLSFLALPLHKIKNRLKHYLSFAFLLALNALAAFFCFRFTNAPKYFANNTDASSQITAAIGDPERFWSAFFSSWTTPEAWELARHFFGVLGWLDTPLHFMLQACCALILILTAVFDHRQDIRVSPSKKCIFGLASSAAILLIFLGLYLAWTPPGHATVLGVQGRYLIPVSPLILLLFYNRKFRAQDWIAYQTTVLPIYWTISLAWTSFTLMSRYYRLPF